MVINIPHSPKVKDVLNVVLLERMYNGSINKNYDTTLIEEVFCDTNLQCATNIAKSLVREGKQILVLES